MAIVQSPSPSPSPSTQDENLHREGRSRSVQKDAHLLSPSFAALNLQSSEDEDRKGRSPSPRRDRGLLAPSDAGTTGQSLQGEPLSRGKSRRRSHSRDRRLEPQGLTVIHEPEGERTADIIFVHGLGGSSRTTWSKDGDDDLFWPEKFLASDPGLSSARMLTFGYMAFFGDLKASGNISITDFARDLLGQLKNGPKPAVGQVPIIFVAHSLGGLVVKKVSGYPPPVVAMSPQAPQKLGLNDWSTPQACQRNFHRLLRCSRTLHYILLRRVDLFCAYGDIATTGMVPHLLSQN